MREPRLTAVKSDHRAIPAGFNQLARDKPSSKENSECFHEERERERAREAEENGEAEPENLERREESISSSSGSEIGRASSRAQRM
jgi:hypothetical protein